MSQYDIDVIIAIDDLTEFYAIQPDIDEMLKREIKVKLLIVSSYSIDMFNDTRKLIAKLGYNTIEHSNKLNSKILLEPYPLVDNINAEFRIKYQYGLTASSLKPNPVYTPAWNRFYDAIVCYSFLEKDIFSVYSKSFLIKPLQFSEARSHKDDKKKVNVLVLFTWGDTESPKKLLEIKEALRDNYNLIVKVHHAAQYRPDHKGVVDQLKNVADEYYDATTNVNTLFSKADVVLSDYSSAIFTAIYLGIPVAIFAEKHANMSSLGDLKAAHVSLLIEPRAIPYTDDISEISAAIDKSISNMKHQNKLKKELFPSDPITTLADVVEEYLQLRRKEIAYYQVKDYANGCLTKKEDELKEKTRIINQIQEHNNELISQLSGFLGIKRSSRLVLGNIKRKIKNTLK